jgi:hypothetical protein
VSASTSGTQPAAKTAAARSNERRRRGLGRCGCAAPDVGERTATGSTTREREIDDGAAVVEVDDAADEDVPVLAVVVADVDVGLAELVDRRRGLDP